MKYNKFVSTTVFFAPKDQTQSNHKPVRMYIAQAQGNKVAADDEIRREQSRRLQFSEPISRIRQNEAIFLY